MYEKLVYIYFNNYSEFPSCFRNTFELFKTHATNFNTFC